MPIDRLSKLSEIERGMTLFKKPNFGQKLCLALLLTLSVIAQSVFAGPTDAEFDRFFERNWRKDREGAYQEYLRLTRKVNERAAAGHGYYVVPITENYIFATAGEERWTDPAKREQIRLHIKDGLFYTSDGNLFDTSNGTSIWDRHIERTGIAIVTMDHEGNFYASLTQVVGSIHHTTVAGGRPVAFAGEIRVRNGELLSLSDGSGHYRPPPFTIQQAVTELKKKGVVISPEKQTLHIVDLGDHSPDVLKRFLAAGVPVQLLPRAEVSQRFQQLSSLKEKLTPFKGSSSEAIELFGKLEKLRVAKLSYGEQNLFWSMLETYQYFILPKFSDLQDLKPRLNQLATNLAKGRLQNLTNPNASVYEQTESLRALMYLAKFQGHDSIPALKYAALHSLYGPIRQESIYGLDKIFSTLLLDAPNNSPELHQRLQSIVRALNEIRTELKKSPGFDKYSKDAESALNRVIAGLSSALKTPKSRRIAALFIREAPEFTLLNGVPKPGQAMAINSNDKTLDRDLVELQNRAKRIPAPSDEHCLWPQLQQAM